MALPAPSAWAAWPFGPATPKVGEDPGEAAARVLSQAIRIPTVNPPGGEKPLAKLFVDMLKDAGVEARVIDTPRNGSKEGRAAAWGRVKGNGSRRPIVLLSHLDTVPADPKGWAIAPFEGAVGAGSVVGRGALDAKGVSVVHLLTTLTIARRSEPLDRDVIFLATPDEETGGQRGAGYLVRERRSLLYDAELLLTEGGGIQVGEGGTSPVWGVTVTEKAPCWMDIVAEGTPGHSSVAPPVTAVTRLLDALERIRRLETPVAVVPEVARMFRSVAQLAPAEDRTGFRNLAVALETDADFRRRFLSKPGRAALVRNTVAITVLEGSSQTNVLPGRAHAQLDARLLPGQHCADFVEEIERTIADDSIRVEPFLAFTTSSSPVNTPLFRAIQRVASKVDPGAPVVPRVIAGFTDAHYFRDLGIVAYGFVPRWLPPSETRGIHGPNEKISIANLRKGTNTLVQILEALDQR
ncbi:MAG: M20/M25/M40 family metallo-hydrolase [Deltaproteobacteria bacterium]|nr:M20/M25/M40 family metallo-hydrolase [Deltaproteobacteria bacterium]MBW2446842.1 M20/M25/M40 family metallo-hydrolase [Deltaproteobacteria bacterium]